MHREHREQKPLKLFSLWSDLEASLLRCLVSAESHTGAAMRALGAIAETELALFRSAKARS